MMEENVTLAPAVFLGKLSTINSDLSKEYFSDLKNQFEKFRKNYFLFIEVSDTINDKECQMRCSAEFQDASILQAIESVLSKLAFAISKQNDYSTSVQTYIKELDIPANKVVSIVVNELNSQKLMGLGQALVSVREKNCSLVGLGNITHHIQVSEDITKAIKEFDSWVRVKLWEFDYYALRDIEMFFPFPRNLYLDKIYHYGSFLTIFGSLVGTDVLYDLYTGFEGNSSLRSFYFSTNELVRE